MDPAKRWVDRARAMAALARSTYKLGAGGRSPKADTPFTVRDGVLGSDCIGFVCWCWGIDRFQARFPVYGGWINTDSAIEDARSTRWCFEVVAVPRAGVAGRTDDFPVNLWARVDRGKYLKRVKVIDCAAAKSRRLVGRAIQRTTAAASWNKPDAVFIRFKGLP